MRCAAVLLAVLAGIVCARPGGRGPPPGSPDEAGMMGGFHHHQPPFAKEASAEAKEALKAIMKDDTLTRQQLEEKLDAWATQQGGNILTAYNEFKTKISTLATELVQKIEASSLPDKIKSLAKQLQDVYNDKSLTIKAAAEKAKGLFDQLTDEEKKQVHEFFKQQMPRQRRQAGPGQPRPGQPGPGQPGPALMDKIRLPEFLGKATEEGRQAFKAIVTNKDLTKQQLLDKISEWATAQGSEIKALYDEALKKINEIKDSLKSKVESSSLSAEAKAALNELIGIYENMAITVQQEMVMRKAVIQKQTDAVRKEIMQFLAETMKP